MELLKNKTYTSNGLLFNRNDQQSAYRTRVWIFDVEDCNYIKKKLFVEFVYVNRYFIGVCLRSLFS